ncbi:MAG: glycosyltransferase family 2 protein [Robiginitalea sp.]|uniref:glycosyltransferase family 2 protein n=1 Tax=Robiginitalea sp. TaxID=1902411 RepID=UPI003C7794D0
MVSVITAVYNSENTLKECLDSVLAQTFTDWEHILVDDCSKDDSIAVLREYSNRDPRFCVIQLSENRGAGIARNTAIESARGQYIAFLDCDDIWFPQKLEKQVDYMQKNDYPFTFTSYIHMDESGRFRDKTVIAPEKVSYKSALFKNPIGCLTAMYDTQFYGKQYMPDIRKRQDYALWLKLLKRSNAYGIQECLAAYRVQKKSVSSNKLSLIKYEWLIYRKEEKLGFFQSIFYLLSAIFLKLKSYF